jgi:hypothetical protein
MRNESSGILDGNALFADLPIFADASKSSAPPPPLGDFAPMSTPVVIAEAPITARVPRRGHTTERTRRPVDAMRARLISIIICGSVALVASLFACFLYVTSSPSQQLDARPASAQTAAR